MQTKKKKLFSMLIALAMVFSLFTTMPFTAYAAFPDLVFTLAPSATSVSFAKLDSVTNPLGAGHTYRWNMALLPDGYYSEGDTIASEPVATVGNDLTSMGPMSIGAYINLFEITAANTVFNAGHVVITNNLLRAPSATSTTITGGAGQVTVSGYAGVTNCKLYLVPSSLYPASNSAISIGNANVKEITANGNITGLSAGNYRMYTVYTQGITSPQHGAYTAGSEVTVTAVTTFPDLVFTLAPGASVARTTLASVTNGMGGITAYRCSNNPAPDTHYMQGADMSITGISVTVGAELPYPPRIGSYIQLYGVDASNLLVNKGAVQITNNHLRAPSATTTTITGSAGQVAVSDYSAVTNCKIYLVPSSLYPIGDGAISIGNANVKEVTANGNITGLSAGNYRLYTVYTQDITAPGHGAYTAGSEVAVTAAAVCEIGSTGYTTLDAALSAVPAGGTTATVVKLLQNITKDSQVAIVNKKITFDLNGFNLSISNTTNSGGAGDGLHVENNSVVDCTGSGNFVVSSEYGQALSISGSSYCRVTGVSLNAIGQRAVDAFNSVVIVDGNITVTGDNTHGVDAKDGSTVTVNGNVTLIGDNSYGIDAKTGSTATVNGDVTVTGDSSISIAAQNGLAVSVSGNVNHNGNNGMAVLAYGAAMVVTVGNVTANGNYTYGVNAYAGSTVSVGGDINATSPNHVKGIVADSVNISVSGNVTATATTAGGSAWGIDAKNGAIITVGANVEAAGSGPSYGVCEQNGAKTTIDGAITTSDCYIDFAGDGVRTAAQHEAVSTKAGYLEYTNGVAPLSYVWIKDTAPTTYALTIINGTDNTGASPYTAGTPVSITANAAPSGQVFDVWTGGNGGTFANANSASTTFTMPASAATVTATYKALAVNTYAVNVLNDGNGTANANVNSATAGTEVTLTATPNSGYRFKEWQVTAGGISVISNKFTMPAANVTVNAIFELIPQTTYTITFDAGGGTVSSATMQTGTDGKLAGIPTPTRSGSYRFDGWFTTVSGGTQVTINTVFTTNATVYAHWTPTGGSSPGGGSYTTNANLSITTATFDKNGSVDVSVTLNRGGYTLNAVKNGNKTLVQSADYTVSGNTVTIKAAYLKTLAVGKQSITFDMSGGTDPVLTITITDAGSVNPFDDVQTGAWYYDAVMYVYKQGLMIGTADDIFSPNVELSRAMIVTILYRYAGEPDVSETANPFDDTLNDVWYTNAIKWAYANGIVTGYGNGKFGPNDPVTKEQLAALIYRTQQASGKIPPATTGKTFTDANTVSDWAASVVNTLNNQGIFNDIPGNSFKPQTPATRAEVASMLYKYLTAID